MNNLPYDITPSAREDLRDIARYTIESWGQNQADIYAVKMSKCFIAIADSELVARKFSTNLSHVEFVRCEYHYVFFIRKIGHKPKIIAVLHERMDMLARLKSRM